MVRKVKARRLTRVSSKNQVTLPVAVLTASRIEAGDNVRIESAGDGRIVIVRERDPLDDLIGSAPGLSAATDLQVLRDEWER
jgi:bifunctional DNA-binding transcriptional regulator/antitoxin component of YhaV-PrlF toxin-antitoxin module